MVSRASGVPAYRQIADALREQIRIGRYPPGAQLPVERELQETFGVSSQTVRVALGQLRAEGLVVSRQGVGVFVREATVPRRLSTDVAVFEGWYTMAARHGLQPATATTVTRAACPAEAAEWLDVAEGDEVVVRDRLMRVEGQPPIMLATSYFPAWVVDQAPNLADPNVSGLPRWLREAFGATWSEDVLSCRMPTPAEQDRLQLPPGTPVLTIVGATYDQQRRPLHYISTVAASGRIEFGYRYGAVPADAE